MAAHISFQSISFWLLIWWCHIDFLVISITSALLKNFFIWTFLDQINGIYLVQEILKRFFLWFRPSFVLQKVSKTNGHISLKRPLTNLITHDFWNVHKIWVKEGLCLLIPPICHTYPSPPWFLRKIQHF